MTPSEILLVRHGESAGNVAQRDAEMRAAETIDVAWRDADAPLTDLGAQQARALGTQLGTLPAVRRPVAIWSSPYLRARDTASIAVESGALDVPVHVDDRLRDRELGVLDRLTSHGRDVRWPAEAQRRRWLGKLYYRPPGGESWADVALRLRSLLAELGGPGPVMIATHDAVILLCRYVLERLDETALLDLAASQSVGNASITRLVREGRQWRVAEFGSVAHLERQGVSPTMHGADRDVRPG